MSENKQQHLAVPEISETSRDQKYRHSLQPKSTKSEEPFARHTQSHIYSGRKKVKTKPLPPVIPELDVPEEDSVRISIDATNDNVKLSRLSQEERKQSKHSKGSRKTSQASSRIAFDNVAFEVEKDGIAISRNSSAANSIRSSTRDPSVQSLTVVREQYCCCSRWTPCERALFATVGVLIFIIILLVIAVVLVAVQGKSSSDKSFLQNLFDIDNY